MGSVDFIGFCQPLNPLGEHRDLLLSNPVALYEHSVFRQGVIWNIGSFEHARNDHGQTSTG